MINKSSIKKIILIIAIGLILLIAGRAAQLFFTANLLTNADFGDALTNWQSVSSGNIDTGSHISVDEQSRAVTLQIPRTDLGSWVGVGQQRPVEAERQYTASLDYRLQGEVETASTIVVRLSMFDAAGALINVEEVSPPNPLDAGRSNWQSFNFNFETVPQTESVELGVALFGAHATTIDIDNIYLARPLGTTLSQDSIIRWSSLILGVLLIGYALRGLLGAIVRRRRALAMVAVNITIFFICAEVLAVGFYYFRDGKFFYTRQQSVVVEAVPEQETEELTPYRFHPYFGYIRTVREAESVWADVDVSLRTINNHGLFSDVDYPFVKSNPNQFIIGVFGGSVAEQFALLGRDDFIASLKQNSYFADKKIIVLNFSRGGYKQPQQILVLAYFLSLGQEFDLVLNLDGFNEITLGVRNNIFGTDFTMPTRGVFNSLVNLTDQSTLTPERVESLATINRYKSWLDTLSGQLATSNFAAENFVLERAHAAVLRQYSEELVHFDELQSNESKSSIIFVKQNDQSLDEAVLFERIAQHWVESSIAMRDLLAGRNIPYYHIIQPNQYFSNKTFSQEELENAFDENHPYHPAARRGYPALIAQFKTLEEHGINFYNGIPIFDNVTETVYRDTCCHYNQLGNKILSEFIANAIFESKEFQDISTSADSASLDTEASGN